MEKDYIIIAGICLLLLITLSIVQFGIYSKVNFLRDENIFWESQSKFWHELYINENSGKKSTLLYGCIRGCEIEKGVLTIDNHNACVLTCREWTEEF